MPLAPGARFGSHEIVGFIGAGGMGEVWRARDTRLDREVALKVLPPAWLEDETARKRLIREAQLASKLNHPHVCMIHEVGEAEGQTFVAMELVEGQRLSAHLSGRGLPLAEVLRLGQQLADALAHAHEHGVVHRDFKSANVVLTPEGRAKVLDFGLAKRLAGDGASEATTASYSSLTAPGVVAGTLAYMAPEQLRGQAADARSDIWALGVVLYEMVSGRRPFQGRTSYALSSAILSEPVPALPTRVPDALRSVIERCLEKDPVRRYQRAAEVRAALEALASGVAVPPGRATARRLPRPLWLVAGLVVLTALVTVAITLDFGALRRRLTPRFGSPTRSIRLAVLPFANLSGDPGQEYLSDGVTQEMIAQIGRLHPQSLSVIARTSVMRYKKTETPIDQIGRELGVDYVLEGSAQREAGRVRVSAELIQVRDQTQLWADVYERELSGILALQSDVARKVAGALALKLLPAEEARLAGARAVNPEAYEAYLKGSQHWIKMTQADLDTAEAYFDMALRKDPIYAPAHAGMAWVWAVRGQMGFAPPSQAVPRTREAALKALTLDETLATVHYVLAVSKIQEWDFRGAGPEWKRALELDPNDPDGLAMYSHYLEMTNRPDEAMVQIERALSLDPFNVTIHSFRAVDLLYARRFDEALAQAGKALAMEPGSPVALPAKYWALVAKGKTTEALDAIKDYVTAIGLSDVARALDQGLEEAGFAGAAKRGAEALAAHAAQGEAVPTDVANFYIFAGEKPSALDWLEKAYEARDPNMIYLGLPVYDPLRSEPRFQALIRRLGLTEP